MGGKDAAAEVKFALSTLLSCYCYSGDAGLWSFSDLMQRGMGIGYWLLAIGYDCLVMGVFMEGVEGVS